MHGQQAGMGQMNVYDNAGAQRYANLQHMHQHQHRLPPTAQGVNKYKEIHNRVGVSLIAADGAAVANPDQQPHNYFGNPLKHIGNPLKPSYQQEQKKLKREEEMKRKQEAQMNKATTDKNGKHVPNPQDMQIKPKELAQSVAYNLAVGVATYKILWDPRTKIFRF